MNIHLYKAQSNVGGVPLLSPSAPPWQSRHLGDILWTFSHSSVSVARAAKTFELRRNPRWVSRRFASFLRCRSERSQTGHCECVPRQTSRESSAFRLHSEFSIGTSRCIAKCWKVNKRSSFPWTPLQQRWYCRQILQWTSEVVVAVLSENLWPFEAFAGTTGHCDLHYSFLERPINEFTMRTGIHVNDDKYLNWSFSR